MLSSLWSGSASNDALEPLNPAHRSDGGGRTFSRRRGGA